MAVAHNRRETAGLANTRESQLLQVLFARDQKTFPPRQETFPVNRTSENCIPCQTPRSCSYVGESARAVQVVRKPSDGSNHAAVGQQRNHVPSCSWW